LTPVLSRFSDEAHKTAMIQFLDGISASEIGNEENVYPLYEQRSPLLLKDGHMIERGEKRSFKNLIHQKRRYVTLTDTKLSWQKVKDSSSVDAPSKMDSKGSSHFSLTEITSIGPISEAKHSFRVATPSREVQFQANSVSEMNEWLILIQKQQRRHIMLLNKPSQFNHLVAYATSDVDIEREIQALHAHFFEHYTTLCAWKKFLDEELGQKGETRLVTPGTPENNVPPLPFDKLLGSMYTQEQRVECLLKLKETLASTISAILQIESAYRAAREISGSEQVRS